MSSRPHHFPWRCKSPAQKAVKELTANPFFSYTYLDNTGATLCYRGKAVRVIRCPNCDEPLPGFANFCAACGETLPPAPTSTTIKVSDRPRALKVPHFFSLENDDDASAADLSPETMKFVHRSSRPSLSSSISVAEASIDLAESIEDESSDGRETRYKKNWHKIVDTRPVRTPSLPRIPVSIPRTPAPLPLPSEYLLTQTLRRKPRQTPPALFFWLSMLLLAAIVGGGLFGVVMTLGRGILTQSPPHHDEIALQVMPSSVVLGAIITVRGTNFSPRVHVGLTRDSEIPIVDTANNTIIQADSKVPLQTRSLLTRHGKPGRTSFALKMLACTKSPLSRYW